MDLPNDLAPYRKEAYAHLFTSVKDVEFSGPTYQILISAKGEEAWVFLSLSPFGKIEDVFCPLEDEQLGSLFKTIAYLWVFQKKQPYHLLYEQCFWKKTVFLFFSYIPETSEWEREGSLFSLFSPKRDCGVQISFEEGKESFFEGILFDRLEETEETSLKFSHVPLQELELWRQGRPSQKMRFELSFWNDLGKRLFFASQFTKDFSLEFTRKENSLPLHAEVCFDGIVFFFTFAQKQLEELVLNLRTANSNLSVFVSDEAPIEAMVFDQELGTIKVERGYRHDLKRLLEKSDEKIQLGEWIFLPPDKFYHKNFMEKPLVEEHSFSQIDQFLSSLSEREWTLLAYPYHVEPVFLRYFLEFDQNFDLHIYPYIHSPRDLQQRKAWLFSKWAFTPEEGFQAIKGVYFPRKHTVIFKENVSSFVTEMQSWLAEMEGFQTHLAPLSAQVAYTLSEKGSLYFHHVVDKKEEGEIKDFGRWTYVEKLGFFQKTAQTISLPIGSSVPITSGHIPHFIEQNKDELQSVLHFFSKKNPVLSISLSVSYKEKGIYVEPIIEFEEGQEASEVKFFGSYTYVAGEGFYKLPPNMLLPEKWQSSRHFQQKKWSKFFEEELETLLPYVSIMSKQLQRPKNLQLLVKDAQEGENSRLWLTLAYRSELGDVPLKELIEAFHKGQKYICTESGLLNLEDTRFRWFARIFLDSFENEKTSFSIAEFFRLDALEPLEIAEKKEEVEELFKRIKEQKNLTPPDLSLLKSSLRPYQQSGLYWLWFLYKQGLSGLLCDEMGLGKTHQAMALVAAIFQESKMQNKKVRFLIICPTSVLFHWAERIEEHLLGVKLFIYHGTSRDRNLLHCEGDIVLTSYGILRRELDLFKTLFFEVVIYDELHIAKNHDSRLHKSLRSLKARMQLGMTGTPIENNLKELKALFDILLPGYMPSKKEFEEFYIKPIEKERVTEKQELLSRFIAPFLLRRSKKQVLQDLPEKHESIYYTVLKEEQLHLYNGLLHQERSRVLDEFSQSGKRGYMQIFALITKLKQICDHPALFYGDIENYEKYSSGKWELFKELLEEVQESGHKVVVFSQYLGMLAIIKQYCKKNKIGYASIEGKTKDRKEQVHKFQKDPSCKVFAGSLLASGVGIDLTAASYVVHYDRWWNPAKENQATDRVHRIGLLHGVEVYKLFTKHTIEERIHAVLEEKKRLFKDVIEASETSWVRTLDLNEMHALFDDAYLPK